MALEKTISLSDLRRKNEASQRKRADEKANGSTPKKG